MTITEEWARNAPAGAELDRVCDDWMLAGAKRTRPDPYYSSSWSAAGPLLEAMSMGIAATSDYCNGWVCGPISWRMSVTASTYSSDPCLAIARACALLVVHGIKREDL